MRVTEPRACAACLRPIMPGELCVPRDESPDTGRQLVECEDCARLAHRAPELG